jgi:ribonucleoside-diphosphate reductase alpha chain
MAVPSKLLSPPHKRSAALLAERGFRFWGSEISREESMSNIKPSACRQRLPDRRAHELFDFDHGGLRFTAGIGRFGDGRLAEIFISNSKGGSQADCNVRDASVVASIALQYGAPLDVIRKALMRDARGNGSGALAVALDLVAEENAP